MGDPIRDTAKEAIIPRKPVGKVVLWQASDGSLYALTSEDGFNAALSAEYGPKWARKIGGTFVKESLNALFSTVKTVPGAGTAEYLGLTGLKILAKGISNNLGAAISGEELKPNSIAYNFYSELFKLSNYAPGAKMDGGTQVAAFANTAYKYKNFITTNDPGFSKFKFIKLKDVGKTAEEYLIKGDIGFFSIGKRLEKGTITYIKHKLAHKPESGIEEIDLTKYAANWDGTDLENFDRFIKLGYTVNEAIAYTNQRDKGLSYTVNEFAAEMERAKGVFMYGSELGQSALSYKWDEFQKNSKESDNAFMAALSGNFTPAKKGAIAVWNLLELGVLGVGAGGYWLLGNAEEGMKGIISSTTSIFNASTDVVTAAGRSDLFKISPEAQAAQYNQAMFRPGKKPEAIAVVENGKVVIKKVNSVVADTSEKKTQQKVVVSTTTTNAIQRSVAYAARTATQTTRTVRQLR